MQIHSSGASFDNEKIAEKSQVSKQKEQDNTIFASFTDNNDIVESGDVSFKEGFFSNQIDNFLKSNLGESWSAFNNQLKNTIENLIQLFNNNNGVDEEPESKTKISTGKTEELPTIDTEQFKDQEEVRNLKDMTQMSDTEIIQELSSYGLSFSEGTKRSTLEGALKDARIARFNNDKGSDEVDGHIGTYVQGESKYCTVLAQLDNMSDQEVQQMYSVRTDENGQKIYTVTFPQDYGTEGNSVEITEEELKSGSITVEYNGEDRTISDFPTGDADATMITMAFVKRFGAVIQNNGAWAFDTQNRFTAPDQEQVYDNQHVESVDFATAENLPSRMTIGVLSTEELQRKGLDPQMHSPSEMSWLRPEDALFVRLMPSVVEKLSDGREVCVTGKGIFMSDGTSITGGHNMSIRGFDYEKQEVIISGNEMNNGTETRIPMELLKYMDIPTHQDTAGVSETPQPDARAEDAELMAEEKAFDDEMIQGKEMALKEQKDL